MVVDNEVVVVELEVRSFIVVLVDGSHKELAMSGRAGGKGHRTIEHLLTPHEQTLEFCHKDIFF